MNIYDVRFYGWKTSNKIGNTIIVINADDSETKNMPRKITFEDMCSEKFSISLYEECEGKKDVLHVEYATGKNEYYTLHKPWYSTSMKLNGWHEIEENEFAIKFADLYAKVVLQHNAKLTGKSKDSIFARSFWIVKNFESYDLRVFAKEVEARNYALTIEKETHLFEARVLPEYKGKEYVLCYKEQYFTFFDLLYSYDEGAGKWYIHEEPDRAQIKEICAKVKDAYIKDIAWSD